MTNASPTTSSTPPPPLAITSPLSSWHPPYPPPTPSRSSTAPCPVAVLSSSMTKNYWSPTALIPPTVMSVTALLTPQSLTLPSARSSIMVSLLLPWIPSSFSTKLTPPSTKQPFYPTSGPSNFCRNFPSSTSTTPQLQLNCSPPNNSQPTCK